MISPAFTECCGYIIKTLQLKKKPILKEYTEKLFTMS